MGMFDTVYFENPIACAVCQAPIASTQTKVFDCTLDNYRVGDCIAHAEEIRIVRENLYCDACHALNQQVVKAESAEGPTPSLRRYAADPAVSDAIYLRFFF